MERTARKAGVQVGDKLYTDLDYADDVVLTAEQTETLRSVLVEFHQTASNLGLHLSWQKTKVQNLGSGDPAADITVAGNTIEAVTVFRYLGSIQSSSGRHTSTDWTGFIRHALDAALLATTETKSEHQAATLSDLCSSYTVARC